MRFSPLLGKEETIMSEYGIVLQTPADKDLFTYLQQIKVNHDLMVYEGTPESLHQDIVDVVTAWLDEVTL